MVDGKFEKIEGTDFELPCELVLLAMGFLGPRARGLLDAARRRARRARQRGARRVVHDQRARRVRVRRHGPRPEPHRVGDRRGPFLRGRRRRVADGGDAAPRTDRADGPPPRVARRGARSRPTACDNGVAPGSGRAVTHRGRTAAGRRTRTPGRPAGARSPCGRPRRCAPRGCRREPTPCGGAAPSNDVIALVSSPTDASRGEPKMFARRRAAWPSTRLAASACDSAEPSSNASSHAASAACRSFATPRSLSPIASSAPSAPSSAA